MPPVQVEVVESVGACEVTLGVVVERSAGDDEETTIHLGGGWEDRVPATTEWERNEKVDKVG